MKKKNRKGTDSTPIIAGSLLLIGVFSFNSFVLMGISILVFAMLVHNLNTN